MIDKIIGIYGEHRITKGMTETITYMAQLVPSFERASIMQRLFLAQLNQKGFTIGFTGILRKQGKISFGI